MAKIGVSILGGSGYGAGELLRLLSLHEDCEVVSVVSSSSIGKEVTSLHPHLRGFYELRTTDGVDFEKLSSYKEQVIFSALPHGVSCKEIEKILLRKEAANVKFIDLSGDFRIGDIALHKEFYPDSGALFGRRSEFVYGLTEINKKRIQGAKLLANPGCYATCCILAAAPLVASSYVDSVIFDAKSGTSGGGRSPQSAFHHAHCHGNFSSYKALAHRHEPEILDALSLVSSEKISTVFVPHLLPTVRGILVSAYFELNRKASFDEISSCYENFYGLSSFVRRRDTSVNLHDVIGTNFFDYSIALRNKQLVVTAVIDNLVKGMAGQAIQNMNLMCNVKETTALWQPSLGIV